MAALALLKETGAAYIVLSPYYYVVMIEQPITIVIIIIISIIIIIIKQGHILLVQGLQHSTKVHAVSLEQRSQTLWACGTVSCWAWQHWVCHEQQGIRQIGIDMTPCLCNLPGKIQSKFFCRARHGYVIHQTCTQL